MQSMVVKLSERERATVLAALRRWLSYPAAREADSIATNRGKHKPLDDGEIQRLCKRVTQTETKVDGEPSRRHTNNGADVQKATARKPSERSPSIRAPGLQRRNRPTRG